MAICSLDLEEVVRFSSTGSVLRRRSLLVVMALGLLIALLPGTGRAGAEAGDRQLTVSTWNIAGSHATFGGRIELLHKVHASMMANDPDVVVLNEICHRQYKYLQGVLQQQDWSSGTSFTRYTKMDDHHGCSTEDGSDTVGMALFSKEQLAAGIDSVRLPLEESGSDRGHYLSCATAAATETLKFCFTHLTSKVGDSDEYGNAAQVAELTRLLNGLDDAGNTVVVAGDFNALANDDRLNGLYSAAADTENNPDNHGAFREVDDTDPGCPGYGEATSIHPPKGACDGAKKIDFIFANESRLTGSHSAESLPHPVCKGTEESQHEAHEPVCSDHRNLIGTVTVQP